MMAKILRRNKKDFHTQTQNSLRSTPSSFKPALVVGGLLKLRYRANRLQIRKEDWRIDFVKTNEIARKHLILCSSISDKWKKTLKTTNKVAGPIGNEGVLGGVNRCRNAGKSANTQLNRSQNEFFPTRPR